MYRIVVFFVIIIFLESFPAYTLEREDKEFKVFQFPPNIIPRIDGDPADWTIVPDHYAVGVDELCDMTNNNPINKNSFDVTVKVGWVQGLNRLYVLYEAYDDYWDFEKPGLGGDIFEIVVDGDLSGGPLIPQLCEDLKLEGWDGYMFHGVHAQNYHIFTPAEGKEWAMVWGCQPWIADFPYCHFAYDYDFQHGESGDLIFEFWITPYDYAPYNAPERAIESELTENKTIGLSWSILDFDGDNRDGHYNLAHDVRMVRDASYLCAFKLMPIEAELQENLRAEWSFNVIDMNRRKVAFKDESIGQITEWKWDFGDGSTSNERNPIHVYKNPGVYYVVTLQVNGPDGSSKRTRYWEVMLK